MSYRPPVPVPAARAILLAAVAALIASALLLLATWGARAYIGAYHPTPDANIGAGMLLTALPVLLAPLLSWPLLRLLRLPHPGLTALFSVPPLLILSFVGLMLWVEVDVRMPVDSAYTSVDPLLTTGAVDAVVLVLSLAAAALVTSRLHAARHAREHGADG